MSTVRERSPASYALALPAGLWMLAALVAPTLFIVWVSFWAGRGFTLDTPLSTDNYAKFFTRRAYVGVQSTFVNTGYGMAGQDRLLSENLQHLNQSLIARAMQAAAMEQGNISELGQYSQAQQNLFLEAAIARQAQQAQEAASRRGMWGSLIGAGSMGEVYRARDTALNRDVALKVLPSLLAFDPGRVARFRREARDESPESGS